MAQALNLKLSGLHTDANPLGSVPEGALLVAKNIVIDKQDVAETRRGFKLFGSSFTLSGSDKINCLFAYKDRKLAHYGSKLCYDSTGAGVWSDYAGSYSAPSGANRIRSAQANKNFYFTTSTGVKKLSAIAGSVGSAGTEKALGGSASTTGASGFLANSEQVAYRVVWGIEDANENEVLGAPSQRIIAGNNSGGTRDVSLTFLIPSTITTSHFYRVYRSGASGGLAVEPNDELQLVIEKNPTSAEITAKSVTITDNVPDTLRGATLYTSPSQEGIGAANDQPPLSKDIVEFKNTVLYVNTISKHRFFLNLTGVGSGSFGYYAPTGNTTNGVNTITSLSASTGVAIGQLVTGTGIPAGTTVTSIVGSTATLSANATATGTGVTFTFRDHLTVGGVVYYANSSTVVGSNYFEVFTAGTPAENIEDTALSLASLINQSASTTAVYAFYLSGYDDLPGQLLIEERGIGGSTFYNLSSKGSSFSPALNNTGTSHPSSNEEGKNRIYFSKDRQPEAVPILNYLLAGSAEKDIIRAIALRDSVFLFKDDGIYRITGEDAGSFRVTLFDNTAKLRGPDTAVAFSNQVFCFSDQGVIAVSDNGVAVVSRSFESDLFRLSSSNFPNFNSASFGVAYESARKYILFTVTETDDEVATQAFVYNSFTNAWTTWVATRTCGLVDPVDDKLYLGSGDSNKKYLYVERKNFDLFDYAEEEFPVTLSAYSGTTVTLDSTAEAVVGNTLAQGIYQIAVITEVLSATQVVVDREVEWTIAAAMIYQPVEVELRWSPVMFGNPGLLKQFKEILIFFRQADFQELDLIFTTNIVQADQTIGISPIRTGSFGDGRFGAEPWGGGAPNLQPIRTFIPLECQRGHWLNLKIVHAEALTVFALCGFSLQANFVSSRAR